MKRTHEARQIDECPIPEGTSRRMGPPRWQEGSMHLVDEPLALAPVPNPLPTHKFFGAPWFSAQPSDQDAYALMPDDINWEALDKALEDQFHEIYRKVDV